MSRKRMIPIDGSLRVFKVRTGAPFQRTIDTLQRDIDPRTLTLYSQQHGRKTLWQKNDVPKVSSRPRT